MSTLSPKIVITGTGRAGTTFLVRLLTELGLDTGYTAATWQRDYHAHCSAGLEHDPADPASPRIVKSPKLCLELADLLARRRLAVEHAIVPIRSLADAARSRIRVGGAGETPGGMYGTADPAQQEAVLAGMFHRLIHTLVSHNIPHTFLDFPRFARDPAYTWSKLSPIFPTLHRDVFDAAFARCAEPALIHNFSNHVPADTGEPARQFARLYVTRRLRRRLGRTALAASLSVAVWFLALWWQGRNADSVRVADAVAEAQANP